MIRDAAALATGTAALMPIRMRRLLGRVERLEDESDDEEEEDEGRYDEDDYEESLSPRFKVYIHVDAVPSHGISVPLHNIRPETIV